MKLCWAGGACLGFLGVATGALGAHGLKEHLSAEELGWWHTGSQYALWHACALLAVALCQGRRPALRGLSLAGPAFLGGALLFSGTLWAMAIGGPRWLGAVTPLGGLALLFAWACLAWAGCSMNSPAPSNS